MYSTYYGSRQDGYGYNADMLREGFDLLEARADCLGWWSVARRVLRSYGHQPIIRLRRSSDSTERDFYGIGPQGEVSTSEVRAWNGWNLLGRTENFADASWVRTGLNAISASIETPPIAGLAVFSMTEDTSTGGHNVLQNFASFAASTQVTFSVYAKAAGRSVIVLRCTGLERTYTLTGSGSVSGGGGASIQSLGDGWYRLSNTQTIPDTALRDYTIRLNNGSGISYTGDGTSGILLGGVQLEAAASATTYETRSGAGAGSSFLVTLYDQSGLGRHATQSTTTLQRIVCEQGVLVTTGGRLASRSVAADARRAAIGSSTSMFNQLHTTGGTLFLIEQTNDTSAAKVVMGNQTATNAAGFRITRTSTEAVSTTVGRLDVAGVATNGNSVSVAAHADSSQLTNTIKVFSFDPDNATAESRLSLWINGTANATANAESGTPFVENASGNMTFGAAPDGSSAHDGLYVESAMFGSVIGTTDRTTLQSRSGNFYGVTIS